MKCVGFSCCLRWDFKALLLQRVEHILKFMCLYVVLVVSLKEKGGVGGGGGGGWRNLCRIFPVRSNNVNNNKNKITDFSTLESLQAGVFKTVSSCYRKPCTNLDKIIFKNVYMRRRYIKK